VDDVALVMGLRTIYRTLSLVGLTLGIERSCSDAVHRTTTLTADSYSVCTPLPGIA
jgi:hypothetical protein